MAERMGDLDGARVVVLNWRDRAHPLSGGAEEYAHRVADSLCAAGARVTFFSSHVDGQPSRTDSAGITLLRKGNRWTVYLWALLWLVRNRRRVDVVVDCQNGIPFFSPLVLRRRTRVVLVMHHVHDKQFGVHFPAALAGIGRWLEGPASRWAYRRAVTVAVSPSTVRAMRTRLGWRGRIFVVPNGMAGRPVESGPRATEPTLVCLGRLVVHKRVDRVIAAVAELLPRWPSLRLHVIGRGPEQDAIRAGAAALGDAVRVHGFLDEEAKAELLRRSWLSVILSDGEGWGQAGLEAAAHGVPTVCRDVDGMRDSVRDGETGWLVAGESTADVVATVDAALSRLSDEASAAEMAKACQEWAGRFDWARTGRRFVALVADLRAGRIRREWTAEALVAEFTAPEGFDREVLSARLGARTATGDPVDGTGWLLVEQCRAEDVIAALTHAGCTGVRIRPAEDLERLLGGPARRLGRVAPCKAITVG